MCADCGDVLVHAPTAATIRHAKYMAIPPAMSKAMAIGTSNLSSMLISRRRNLPNSAPREGGLLGYERPLDVVDM